jgi:hypothetical protein
MGEVPRASAQHSEADEHQNEAEEARGTQLLKPRVRGQGSDIAFIVPFRLALTKRLKIKNV